MTPDDFAAEMRRILDAENEGWQSSVRRAVDLMVKTLREHGYGAGCDIFEGFKRD